MLVLSRKPQEAICIDDEIQVTVLEIRGNRVRLGIAAPSHLSVCRGELSGVPTAQCASAGLPIEQPTPK